MHEYYYEWDDYWFTDGALFLLARSHADEPEEADFMGINLDGESREIALTDLSHPLFIAAYAYLLTEGKVKIQSVHWQRVQSHGYTFAKRDLNGCQNRKAGADYFGDWHGGKMQKYPTAHCRVAFRSSTT
jgi:hypothetical protein